MYRQQISRKTFPLNQRTSVSRMPAPTKNFAPLSNVVQRAQQDPNSVSGDEWQALHSAIGTRAVRKKQGRKLLGFQNLRGFRQSFGVIRDKSQHQSRQKVRMMYLSRTI